MSNIKKKKKSVIQVQDLNHTQKRIARAILPAREVFATLGLVTILLFNTDKELPD